MYSMKNPKTLDEYLDCYIKLLKLERKTKCNLKSTREDINCFIRYLKQKKITDLKKVTKKDLDNYQTHLYYWRYPRNGQEHKLSTVTQIKRLSVLRTFFRHLVQADLLYHNPASDIELPKRPQTLPRGILTKKELKKLFNACNLNTVYGYRDRVIFEVFYATGVRITELACLKIGDLDLKEGYLRILEGKGLKDRTVPLTNVSIAYLTEYLQNVRPHLANYKKPEFKDLVFLTRSGTFFEKSAMLKMLKIYQKKIKLDYPLTGHTFRHTLATELLRGGADIRQIQEILGHESLSTTQKYVHIIQDDLKKVHSKTHPREQVKSQSIIYKGAQYY